MFPDHWDHSYKKKTKKILCPQSLLLLVKIDFLELLRGIIIKNQYKRQHTKKIFIHSSNCLVIVFCYVVFLVYLMIKTLGFHKNSLKLFQTFQTKRRIFSLAWFFSILLRGRYLRWLISLCLVSLCRKFLLSVGLYASILLSLIVKHYMHVQPISITPLTIPGKGIQFWNNLFLFIAQVWL